MKLPFGNLFGALRKKAPAAPTKKYASAYRFKDRLLLHSRLQTPFGQFASEPFKTLALDSPPQAVAAAILAVLEASHKAEDTPHGKNFGKWSLEQLGVKSAAQLQRESSSISIVNSGMLIEFVPNHNGGASGDGRGFRPIQNAAVSVAPTASPAEMAAAFHKAFGLCTSVYGREK